MSKLQELKTELKEDKFRSERGQTNDASLFKDLLQVFGEDLDFVNSTHTKVFKEGGTWEDKREKGSGLFSALAYQNLILLDRVEQLEKKLEKVDD